MSYLSYKGPADVVLFQGETAIELPGLVILFSFIHTFTCSLSFIPDRPERERTTRVRVTLADGTCSEGSVTYTKQCVLIFRVPDPYFAERGLSEPYFE
ncbi:MAG: hypothetical protein ACRER8_12360 [Pseudomonas sp.]|uniref:hypothetical protein n=1 Tax=Pseudomonas sp. TaxID=306 RepID=UPI003D6E02A5